MIIVTPDAIAPSAVEGICQSLARACFIEDRLNARKWQIENNSGKLADKREQILQVGHRLRFDDPATLWLRRRSPEWRVRRGRRGSRPLRAGFKRRRNDSSMMFAEGSQLILWTCSNFILEHAAEEHQSHGPRFPRSQYLDDVSLPSLEYETAHGKTLGDSGGTECFIPGKFREVIVCGDKLSTVCDSGVSGCKMKTYANTDTPARGDDFEATAKATVTRMGCPPRKAVAGGTARVYSTRSRPAPRRAQMSSSTATTPVRAVLNAALESSEKRSRRPAERVNKPEKSTRRDTKNSFCGLPDFSAVISFCEQNPPIEMSHQRWMLEEAALRALRSGQYHPRQDIHRV